MMDEGGVEVDGKSDEAMLKVICETDAGRMNHVICVVPSDVLSPHGAPRSYSEALRTSMPVSHINTLTRAKMRSRQILINKDPSANIDVFSSLNEQELVMKANIAAAKIEAAGRPGNKIFIGVKKLANGGIVFDLATNEINEWIQTNKKEFINKFSTAAIMKDHTVSIIVEYIPTNHTPDALAELRRIKRNSQLPANTLASTRWVKLLQRRSPGQTTAHIIAKFSSIKAANLSIRGGLIITGKRTWGRRLRREPRRCLKCQKLNARHMAATCDQNDVCRTCGQGHRTAQCKETDHELFHCKNCNTYGHASWDRTCPQFIEICNKLEQTDPENTYKYFPNDSKWTWEQRPTGNDNAPQPGDGERRRRPEGRATQQ